MWLRDEDAGNQEQIEQENAIWPWLADDSMADQEPESDVLYAWSDAAPWED